MRAGSLFSGIGGFDIGLEAAGFDVRWQVEIDGAARSVLQWHFPSVHRHDDVREVGLEQLEPVDLVAGGFPCQDLSVAGRRAGLGGERSGLWWEFHRVLSELRPRWCLVENVPGLLSAVCPGSDGQPIPGGGCNGGCMRAHGGAMGLLLGSLAQLGYGFAYRVLDARFFGLAQRRRRVLIVGCLGDGRRAAQVLLEPEGLRRDLASCGAARADVAGTLGGQPKGSGWRGDLDRSGAFVAVDLQNGGESELCGTFQAGGQASGNRGYGVLAHALTNSGNGRMDPNGETLVLADAVTPGDARVPRTIGEGSLVADTLRSSSGKSTSSNAQLVTAFDRAQITSPENRSNPAPDGPAPTLHGEAPLIAGTLAGERRATGDSMQHGCPIIAATLASGGNPNSNAPGRRHEDDENLVTFRHNASAAQTMRTDPHVTDPHVTDPLKCSPSSTPAVYRSVGVRRLTPTECERLQGFPDDWTKGQSDAARYRQLGNALPPQMAYWVARRIAAADDSGAAVVARDARGEP